MKEYVLGAEAALDLEAVWEYIAQDDIGRLQEKDRCVRKVCAGLITPAFSGV
jgi:hypothetical protein